MDAVERKRIASELMLRFADRTGLTSNRPVRRYLWTDAFAVTNFLGLAQATGEQRYAELALRLVDQVHHTLGRHRPDESKQGWLSGLDQKSGELHPTRGGLRIGKTLPERQPGEPFDDRLEWERDGQYFHYLTKWMHALDQVARFTHQPSFHAWARELADSARAFTYAAGGRKRMYWKMSIDLSRAQVASMGHHDPLDGYITCLELQATAASFGVKADGPDLEGLLATYAAMLEGRDLTSPDPLGLGGLLSDAYRALQLEAQGADVRENLVEELLAAALSGLDRYVTSGEYREPAHQRLAFRELGLTIGLHAARHMSDDVARDPRRFDRPSLEKRLAALRQFAHLRDEIESFWVKPANQRVSPWTEHQDINEVMLATSLVSEGFVVLHPLPAR